MTKKSSSLQEAVMTAKQFRIVAGIAIMTIGVGTVVYHYVEKWNWLDAVYASTITLTTVGYGDFVPKTNIGKIFTIFYVLVGVGIIATSLNILVRNAAQKRVAKIRKRRAEKQR